MSKFKTKTEHGSKIVGYSTALYRELIIIIIVIMGMTTKQYYRNRRPTDTERRLPRQSAESGRKTRYPRPYVRTGDGKVKILKLP